MKKYLYLFIVVTLMAISVATPQFSFSETTAPTTPTAPDALPMHIGFPRTEPYGSFFSSPTPIDLYNNRSMVTITADSTGCVWGFDRNGDLAAGFPWKTGDVCDNEPRINGPLAFGDLDGDGKIEIVAGTRGSGTGNGQRGKVFVWNRWGVLLPGWPKEMAWANITNGNFPEVMSVGIADIAGDSKLEIIAATSNEAGSDTNNAPNLYAWYANGSSVSGYPTSSNKGSGIFGLLGIADLDKDGKSEVLVGRDEIYFYAYNGEGQNMNGWPLHTFVDVTQTIWGTHDFLEFTRSAPAVGDLDGDGKIEIVTAGKIRSPSSLPTPYMQTSSGVIVSDVAGNRRTGWTAARKVGPPRQVAFTPNNQVALADLDRNGKLDIVVTFDDGTIRAFREDGSTMWTYDYAQGQALFASEVAIGDVSGDGLVDIVFGTYSVDQSANNAVRLHGLNASGQPLAQFPLALPNENSSSSSKGIMAGPTIADIDGNCQVEILAHSRGGVLYAWDTKGLNLAKTLPWPMSRRDPARSGTVLLPVTPAVVPPNPALTNKVYLPLVRSGCGS